MAHSFHVSRSAEHLKWSKNLKPVLTVPSGSEVSFDLKDGGGNQFRPDNISTALETADFSLADPGFGPVYVEGAEPGDVLKVEFSELKPAEYGWTAILTGFGILADEFSEQKVHLWDLRGVEERGYVVFERSGGKGNEEIRIPFAPFLGLVGVAPEEGEWPMIPPLETGGNIDCRHITAGSELYLPVKVPGALFSAGDGHAAQGDGEVCGTAIETPMKAKIRLTVVKNSEMPWVKSPAVLTAPHGHRHELAVGGLGGREYMSLGIDSDLREATRKAVRGVVDWLVSYKGLERSDAYMLCSVAASLKMCEVVDMPNYAIGCSIPLGIFVKKD